MAEKKFDKASGLNFSNLMKNLKLDIKETQRSPKQKKKKTKKITPRCMW